MSELSYARLSCRPTPVLDALAERCMTLQRHMRARHKEPAAFHVPRNIWEKLRRELRFDDKEALTIIGVKCLEHDGPLGVIAEQARAPDPAPRWRTDWNWTP